MTYVRLWEFPDHIRKAWVRDARLKEPEARRLNTMHTKRRLGEYVESTRIQALGH